MPGPAPKSGDRRQRRNARPGVVVSSAPDIQLLRVPEPPAPLLDATKAQWRAFWNSPLARSVDPVTDLPALERLFSLRDERERCYRGFRKKRLTEGSQGQPVINPLGTMMLALDAEIRGLEDRFGLSTKSRLQLGIVFAEAAQSIEKMNRDLDRDSDRDGDEEDPRLSIAR